MRVASYGLAMVLAGCSSPSGGDGPDDGGGGVLDTGALDSGLETGEACEGMWVRGTLTVPADVDVPAGAVTVDLVGAELVTGDLVEEEVLASTTIGPILAGEAVDYALCVPPVPTADDLYTLDGLDEMPIVTYSLRARAAGGTWVGASWPTMLTWLEGTIPVDWLDGGAAPGWNVLHVLRHEGAPFTDESTFDFAANLLWEASPTVSGTVAPDFSQSTDLRVGAYNINRFTDISLAAPAEPSLVGEPLSVPGASTPFDLGLSTPPEDHTVEIEGYPFCEAGYFTVQLWAETTGDDRWQPTEETLLANATSATPQRRLLYLEPSDWRASLAVDQGWPMGWSILEEEALVDWSTGLALDGS
jgi:hypothetical protein